MQIFAHLDPATADGLRHVSEIITLDNGLVLGRDMYVTVDDVFALACKPCDATVEAGWTYDGTAFAPPVPKPVTAADLIAYAAAKRFTVETGGVVVGGAKIATDRDSQAMIGNAFAYVTASNAASVRFKAASGWVTLSADQVKALALAVGAHVQAAFAAEDDLDAAINASPPTVTSFAQIDAAPWPANA